MQWRWPKQWPFPADYLEVVDVQSVQPTPLGDKAVDAFQEFIGTKISDNECVLEIGDTNTVFLSKQLAPQCNIEYLDSQMATANPWSVATNSFDLVIVSSGVETFLDAREVYRSIWKVLKPGGKCITCFSGKTYTPVEKTKKMWTTMNDEQKIWIAGSYYHYSAGEGWEDIEGYDLLNSTGGSAMVFDGDKKKNVEGAAYAVTARKLAVSPPGSPDFAAYNYSKGTLAGLSADMDVDDRDFCSLRIATEYDRKGTDAERQDLLRSVNKLPTIYEILKEVKAIVVPPAVKAMLAVFVLESWQNTVEQREALKMGLGISTPNDFWTALGAATNAMPPREKILLLADVMPHVGNNPNVSGLPVLLQELQAAVRTKLPEVEEMNVQVFVVDIAITNFLMGLQPAERIIKYIDSLGQDDLSKFINDKVEDMLK